MNKFTLAITGLTLMSCSMFQSQPIKENVIEDGFGYYNRPKLELNKTRSTPPSYGERPSPASQYIRSPVNSPDNTSQNQDPSKYSPDFADKAAEKYDTLTDEQIAERAFREGYNIPVDPRDP